MDRGRVLFDEMAKKTVLKKLLKYMPLKTEFVKGSGTDENNQKLRCRRRQQGHSRQTNEWVDADVNIVDEDTRRSQRIGDVTDGKKGDG